MNDPFQLYENMTVAELKEILRGFSLPVSGRKAELIERIQFEVHTLQAIEEEEQSVKVEDTFQYDEVKGLEPLINWAKMTGRLFTPEAAAFGFPRFPTGVLLTGVPGCGKSMVAKAIANEWGMGFRRVQPDELVGKMIGDNEQFMRDLVTDLAAKAPIICFIDEAEKILGQTRSPGFYRVSDSARDSAESILLQFMEDDNSGVFFVFTANDYDKMSPALLDRFDGRFFIDLPSRIAREQIIASMLAIRKRDPEDFDIKILARMSEGFTGRDIRSALDDAMKVAFFEDARELTTADLITAFTQTSPTSEVHKAAIMAMRQQVIEGKMRRANSQEFEPDLLADKDGTYIGWN